MKTRKFDTKVQHLKYKVLREVARYAFEDKLDRAALEIPSQIVSGKEATMRCCIYKERAIVGERIRMAFGGDKENPNVIEVLDIACDECPVGGYEVTAVRDYTADTVTDTKTKEVKPTGLPKSNVLYYELTDDAWVCVRPSGTEPKVKFYIGVKGVSMEDADAKSKDLGNAVLKLVEQLI